MLSRGTPGPCGSEERIMSREGTPETIEAFYHSTAWKKCKLAYKSLRNYTCERCGRPGWIVHHKTPLTIENINNPSISLDFSNLELVCLSCHDAEHHRLKGDGLSEPMHHSVRFDSEGNVIVNDKNNTIPPVKK